MPPVYHMTGALLQGIKKHHREACSQWCFAYKDYSAALVSSSVVVVVVVAASLPSFSVVVVVVVVAASELVAAGSEVAELVSAPPPQPARTAIPRAMHIIAAINFFMFKKASLKFNKNSHALWR